MTCRILSIGQLWQGGTALERAQAIESLGASVELFDITPFTRRGNRLVQSLHSRLLSGPNLWALNRAIVDAARCKGPFDIAWVDKGTWILPETLDAIRPFCHRLVHFTPDPALAFHRSRHFRAGLPRYDLAITNKSYELDAYHAQGARRVLLVPQAAAPRFLAATGDAPPPATRLCFVGHCEPHYARTLGILADAGVPLVIHGPGWRQVHGRDRLLGPLIASDGVWGTAYVDAIRAALVGLGLLSRLAPDRFTTRSFEIPAAGRALLAERTDEHRLLFEEDREAVFFASDDELVEKARALIADPPRALAIGAAGRARVRANYQWHQVLAPAFDALGLSVPPDARTALPNPLAALAA